MRKPLRPFFPYYGSKWRLAHRLPAPERDLIVEPFAGSACYSLHHHEKQVLLLDKDETVAELWRWLIRQASAELVLALPDCEDLDSLPGWVPTPARALIGFWLARCSARPRQRLTSMAAAGSTMSRWGLPVRQMVAAQLPSIRHWQVIQGTYQELDSRLQATWFVDPPYRGKAGRRYRCSSSSLNFDELGNWLADLAGQVIVTELADADWLRRLPFRFEVVPAFAARFGSTRPAELVAVRGSSQRMQLQLPFGKEAMP